MKKSLSPTRRREMNVIWKPDKLRIYSKESLGSPTTVLASGDSCERHCRLCGATDLLQPITKDRLDETLRLYFGVQVPPEGSVCQSCVKCMKITEGFSALVHASFNKPISEGSSGHTRILAEFTPGTGELSPTNPQKEILELLTTKIRIAPKKRELRKSVKNNNFLRKKIILACTVCGQKYPMFMSEIGAKKFVCSRCQIGGRDSKKNMQSGHKIELRTKTELRKRNRLNSQPKNPQQSEYNKSATRFDQFAKIPRGLCPRKNASPDRLAIRISPCGMRPRKNVSPERLATRKSPCSIRLGKNISPDRLATRKSPCSIRPRKNVSPERLATRKNLCDKSLKKCGSPESVATHTIPSSLGFKKYANPKIATHKTGSPHVYSNFGKKSMGRVK